MTPKERLVARAIFKVLRMARTATARITVSVVANSIADVLEQDRPGFDRDRFLDAALGSRM